MATQKALVVTALAQPLKSASWPIPKPEAKQVQLRVTVAALNPHDQKDRDYGLFIKKPLNKNGLPAILANDVAGVVTAVGSDVTIFKIGDRVFTYAHVFDSGYSQHGLQQYSVAEEDYAAKIPEGFTDHDAATLPVNLDAGVVGLFDESGLGIPAPWTEGGKTFGYAETSILIIGGGSNCGKFGVQLAKLAGIGKIVVLGGEEEKLKKFGATHVLDRHGSPEAVQARIRDVVGDELIYCYDTVNPPSTQYVGINALSNTKKGKVARLLPNSPWETSKVLEKKAGYEVKDVIGEPHMKTVGKGFWENIERYLREGKIVPLEYEVVQGLDVEKANDVLDWYRDGKKVVQTHFRISA
ncbi:putative alcohol dehydrogenase [Lentithecium fluviatile CBS 122367]|uniref:Putative alcohol dehydrogenase n=1 Tax=Lentithecium fluviatile CBS 122367 TaxID=1168545 RepID=A0A6G1J702_9PLEO|nr:putative alcohol dehydrogenase [Lentithecium fluviatile CBS 122367]